MVKLSIAQVVKKHLSNIQNAYDRRLAEAEAKATKELDKARTRHEREMALLHLKQERLKLKQELSEAKIATQKAKVAAEKARKEAGDLTVGERLGVFGAQFRSSISNVYKEMSKPAKKTSRRKTVRLKTKRKVKKSK